MLLLAAGFPASPGDSVNFKRAYTVNQTAHYSVTMGLPGAMTMTGHVQTTVINATPDGATVRFKALKLDMGGLPASSDPLPDLTTKVGPSGMPNGATIKNSQEFFVFLAAAGITPNQPANIGDSVSVHWQNDPKDVTFDGQGKLTQLDPAAKTLTVAWNLTMTPSGGKFKLTSIYSTVDFSLKSSQGTMEVAGTPITLKVDRLLDIHIASSAPGWVPVRFGALGVLGVTSATVTTSKRHKSCRIPKARNSATPGPTIIARKS